MIKVVNHTMLALDFHANCICVACEECGHRGVVHRAGELSGVPFGYQPHEPCLGNQG